MAFAFGKDQRCSPFLDRLQHVFGDEIVPFLISYQSRIDLVDGFVLSVFDYKGCLANDEGMLESVASRISPFVHSVSDWATLHKDNWVPPVLS